MAKTKISFLERITGARKVENNQGESAPVFSEEEETEMVMRTNSSPAVRDESWGGETEGQLTIDVYQTENDIVIKSTIAGVKPEDLDVSINNDMVTIRGERKNEEEVTPENYYYQECYWGPFSRSVVLPVDVLPEKAEASLKNGILTVRLPKADTTKLKKIQVRGF
ncbi:MAG: Hsp20/alpha crystallin family protein [Candidatus Moranbacteria bacterium]|nr:Hsp20/alpha crystallin family protein [Candidatus Moranbacteria bacterium]